VKIEDFEVGLEANKLFNGFHFDFLCFFFFFGIAYAVFC
jgi:hypothetical protein